ncbi:MAG: response regulator [Gemmatimonadota bacterium]|nr:response regulator [Gemmatimonadota bacterium]
MLVANEQEWSARSLESILGPNGYAVLRAYTGRQAIELARTALPDVIIVDVRMPDIDGLEVCATLRNDPRFTYATPIIVTASAPSARAQRLAALRAGAWDYFNQPLDGEVLLLKLHSYVQAKQAVDRVRDDSLLDPLTGLYNLRGLARRAREIGAEASRHRQALACVAFAPDVESGPVGNGLGSETTATRIAEYVGQVCRHTGRASDAIGRLGLAEFAIIAPGAEASGAVRLVERLRASADALPLELDGLERHVDIRAGYCAVPDFAEASVDAVELLFRATTALRHVRDERAGFRIRSFEDVPAVSLT